MVPTVDDGDTRRCVQDKGQVAKPSSSAFSVRSATELPRPSALRMSEKFRSGCRPGVVPVLQPRGTLKHQAQPRIREGRAATPGLADHLLLRRQGTSRPGLSKGGAGGCRRSDRSLRRQAGRGHPRGDHRPRGAGAFLVQRNRRTLRGVRIHARSPGWQARMDREQSARSNLTLGCRAAAKSWCLLPAKRPACLGMLGDGR